MSTVASDRCLCTPIGTVAPAPGLVYFFGRVKGTSIPCVGEEAIFPDVSRRRRSPFLHPEVLPDTLIAQVSNLRARAGGFDLLERVEVSCAGIRITTTSNQYFVLVTSFIMVGSGGASSRSPSLIWLISILATDPRESSKSS